MAPKKADASKTKSSSNEAATQKFSMGDLVLGHIKGYPPWPAKIVDPEKMYLTKEVLKSKSAKKNHLVKFYTDGNYVWAADKDLKPLTSKAISDHIDNKAKSGPLAKAYRTAQNPEDWEASQEKAMAEAKDGVAEDDELDSEEEVESKPTKDGKRKRKADDKPVKDGADKKKAKTEKKDTKAKGKADKKKTNGEEDTSEGALKCKDWRHKLQKAFLTKGLPSENDAPTYDTIFKEMESFEHQANWLVPSKLPKVVKRIATIKEPIPREEEFNFKSRAAALVEKWKDSLMPDAEMDVDEKKAEDTPAPAAETNGDASAPKEDAAETAEVEKKVEDVSIQENGKDESAAKDEPAAEASKDEEMTEEKKADTEA